VTWWGSEQDLLPEGCNNVPDRGLASLDDGSFYLVDCQLKGNTFCPDSISRVLLSLQSTVCLGTDLKPPFTIGTLHRVFRIGTHFMGSRLSYLFSPDGRILQRRRKSGESTIKLILFPTHVSAHQNWVEQYFYNDVFRYSLKR
jgi:hypothetical protein